MRGGDDGKSSKYLVLNIEQDSVRDQVVDANLGPSGSSGRLAQLDNVPYRGLDLLGCSRLDGAPVDRLTEGAGKGVGQRLLGVAEHDGDELIFRHGDTIRSTTGQRLE